MRACLIITFVIPSMPLQQRGREIVKLSLKHFERTTCPVKTIQLDLKNINSPGFITPQKLPFEWLQTPKVIDRSARDLWSTAREMPHGAEGIMGCSTADWGMMGKNNTHIYTHTSEQYWLSPRLFYSHTHRHSMKWFKFFSTLKKKTLWIILLSNQQQVWAWKWVYLSYACIN